MTANEYKNAGFELSNYVTQALIDRCEADVKSSYIDVIIGTAEIEYEAELMALSFCLMLRRNVTKTRFSTEKKTNQYGTVLAFESLEIQNFIQNTALPAIKSLETKAGVARSGEVNDIINCGYYVI